MNKIFLDDELSKIDSLRTDLHKILIPIMYYPNYEFISKL